MSKPAANLGLLSGARFASEAGVFFALAVLPVFAYSFNTRPAAIVGFLLARVTGSALVGPFGGKLYSLTSGKAGMVAVTVLRALCFVLLYLVDEHNYVALLIIQGTVFGFLSSLFNLLFNSQFPCLIAEGDLTRCTGKVTAAASLGAVAGGGLGGVVSSFLGFHLAFFASLLWFAGSGMFILQTWWDRLPDESLHGVSSANINAAGFFAALGSAGELLPAMLLVLFDALGSAAHNVGLPILSKLLEPKHIPLMAGVILGCWAAGKLIGATLFGRLLVSKPNPSPLTLCFSLGVLLMSISYTLCFNVGALSGVALFAVAAGIGDGIAEVAIVSRIQTEPITSRLRLFRSLSFLQSTGFGAGMLLASAAYSLFNPGVVVLAFHALSIAFASYLALKMLAAWRGAPNASSTIE